MPPWPLCSRAHWVMTGLAGREADWYPQKVSSYLLDYQNPLLLRSPFGEHSHGIQMSSCFLPTQRNLSACLFPKFPCHQSSNHVLPKSLTIEQNHGPQTMNQYIITGVGISFSNESEQLGAMRKFCPQGGFPLTCRDVPERGCSTAAVNSQVVPAYCAEPSVNQSQIYSSSAN